jgi:DNA-binding transcriptional regulator YhcF (GntR family)
MSLILLDATSSEPKYKQIINSILKAIDNNQLKIGDKIDSVNEVSESTGIAKKTVVQAFEELKRAGIIHSVKYKGYFVASRNTQTKNNIFILFNNLSAYKEEIYESIKDSLADKGVVDIFFHHDKVDVFNTLVEKSVGKYTHYIIMPINNKGITQSLESLPQDKVYILDLGYIDWGQKYASVCQYFEDDIYQALKQGLNKIRRYKKIILALGKTPGYNLKHTEKGFIKFCKEQKLDYEVTVHLKKRVPSKGELYIIIDDPDLVAIIKKANELSIKVGKDIGIISYNEIPFKEIIGKGIATISTDFTQMGKNVISLILSKKKQQIKNPCRLIDRPSF